MAMVNNAVSLARVTWWGPGLRFGEGPFLVPSAHQALKESQTIPQDKKRQLNVDYQQDCPWTEFPGSAWLG